MIDLSSICAPRTLVTDQMIAVSETVALRVVSFVPPEPTSNPTVIFIAGWITQITSWQHVLKEMTKDFVVHYVESRDKKSSQIKGNGGYSVEAIGGDIIALTHKLKIDRSSYLLFGSSLGATAILDACRHLNSQPVCLVLIGPNAEFRAPRLGIAFVRVFPPRLYLLFKPFIKWYLKTFRLDTKYDYGQYEKYCLNLDAADPWKLKKAMLALNTYKVWEYLEEVSIPTLIVGGSKDKLHEPTNLRKMISMMPNATYVDLETNEGTHSKRVVEAMRRYLSSLE